MRNGLLAVLVVLGVAAVGQAQCGPGGCALRGGPLQVQYGSGCVSCGPQGCGIVYAAPQTMQPTARKFAATGDHLVFVYMGSQLIGCYDSQSQTWHARISGYADSDAAGYATAVDLRVAAAVARK